MSATDKTYLELCQDLVREAGIPGADGLPSAVTSQTGELGRAVNWVAQADVQIQNLHMDWSFLIDTKSITLTTGGVKGTDDTYTLAGLSLTNLHRYWKKDGVIYKPDADDYKILEYCPWREARRDWQLGASKTSGPPDRFTVKPDRSIVFDTLPDNTGPVAADYGKVVTRMTADGDKSAIPAHLRHIIVLKALQYYAAQEDAPELMDGPDGAIAQYQQYLRQLMAEELPGREHMGVAETSDQDALTIMVP